MIRRTLLGALLGLPFIGKAFASAKYPSVQELESGLSLTPGGTLPRGVIAEGRGWSAVYVGSRYVGDGEYEVKIRLT